MIITHYSTDKNVSGKWVTIDLEGVADDEKFRYYLVDKNYTMYEHRAEVTDGKFKIYMESDSFILLTNYCINDWESRWCKKVMLKKLWYDVWDVS